MKYLRIIILFLIFYALAKGQNDQNNKSLLFETITTNGVSLNLRIFDIIKDPFGFLWLGTDYGLLRYDGYRTIRMDYSDQTQSEFLFNSARIEVLSLGNDSSLWIGTGLGLFNINLKTYEINQLNLFNGINIRSLLIQNDSVLWVGTWEGLFKYNLVSGSIKDYNTINSKLSQNVIRSLYYDNSGNLWVGTENKLNVLLDGENEFKAFDLKRNYKKDIKNNLVLAIIPASSENDSVLLIGTETGLCYFNRITYKYKLYNKQNCKITNEVIKTIYPLNNDIVYLGSDLGFFKVNLRNLNTTKYYHDPFNQYSVVNNEIWKITPDNEGALWLATSNGVSKINLKGDFFKYVPVYVQHKKESIGTRVADVCADNKGNYWIGTGNGIFKTTQRIDDPEHNSVQIKNLNLTIDNINSIFIDTLNRIWIGTVAGLNIWDMNTNKIIIPSIEGGSESRVSSSYISTIFKGYENTLWIGTWGGGLYKATITKKSSDKIIVKYVADLNGQMVLGQNHIWALDEYNLYKFNLNTEKVEEITIPTNILSDKKIFSICYAKDESIWLSSLNKIIKYSIRTDSFQVIKMTVDFDLIVTGLIEDKDGIIWGCSNNSILRYDPLLNLFNYFPLSKNVPLKKFTLSPFRKTKNGNILICGFDGFLKFDPNDYYNHQNENKVFLTSLKINNQFVFPNEYVNNKLQVKSLFSNNNEIHLAYNQRNISIEFSSLLYNDLNQKQYTCILDGFESKWSILEPGTNTAEYINLPPGKYQFKVKRTSDVTNKNITNIFIHIHVPFWISIPFIIIYIIIVLVAVIFIFNQYHQRMKYKTQMGLLRLEKDKNELITASKIKFFINISHELLTSIGLIIDPVKSLLNNTKISGEFKKTLLLIDRNAHFLKVYIDQLLNFRKLETGHKIDLLENKVELVSFTKDVIQFFKNKALSKGVTLQLKSDFQYLTVTTDEEKLYSVVQNLLSNAIKFTPGGGKVVVSLHHLNDSEITIEVSDSGIGIEEVEQIKIFDRFYQVNSEKPDISGVGIGLTIVKDFVEILNGKIELESTPDKGSKFKIILPTIQELNLINNKQEYIKDYVSTDAIKTAQKHRATKIESDVNLPKVLIVDQNEDVFLYIESSLQNKYHILWANCGLEAINILENHSIHLIISEIQLPDMNGLAFCKEVRKNNKTSRIPLIFLTAKTESENQLKAIEAGVDIFLVKPFEIDVLYANIANLLKRAEKTEEFITRRLLMNAQNVEVESHDDKILKEVVDYIYMNISNTNITAKDISYAVGISHSSLYRKIKSITGQTLNEFIRYIRLQKAEKLLLSKKLSVSEIIYEVGFTNHSYFAKCFRKQYGLTPKEYLKQKID